MSGTYSCVQFNKGCLVLPHVEHILVGDGDLDVIGGGLLQDDKVLQVQDDGQGGLSIEGDVVLDDVLGGDVCSLSAVGESGKAGLDLSEEFQSLGRHVEDSKLLKYSV